MLEISFEYTVLDQKNYIQTSLNNLLPENVFWGVIKGDVLS